MSAEVALAHAKLSASGSKKWITCTPSAELEAQFPSEDSKYSSEGTYGHAVFEHRMLGYLGRPQTPEAENELPDSDKYLTQELSDAVGEAVDRAIERITNARSVCKDPVILLEQRLDFSPWVPAGFGTGDLVIITDAYAEVLDLKMGSGVSVSAYENSQFRLYMLGAYNNYGLLYGFANCIGTVLQPRLNNYSSEELSLTELLQWADDVVVPAAKLAWTGEGAYVSGEHCSSGFCKARFTCSARANANMEIAKQDFALVEPALLTDEQISQVLAKASEAMKWLGDVQSFAQQQAEQGHHYAGFKLVAGKSHRRYTSQDAVAAALIANGVDEALIFERSLLGITAMEKTIGKKLFAALLIDLVEKPPGRPTLAPVSDKREEFNSAARAIADFSTQES
jgi:hypothetical protein